MYGLVGGADRRDVIGLFVYSPSKVDLIIGPKDYVLSPMYYSQLSNSMFIIQTPELSKSIMVSAALHSGIA